MVNECATVAVSGCELRYWDSGGDGQPVVLSHGAGADHIMFADQVASLVAQGYRTVTWDMRGHGASRPGGETFTAQRAVADLLALVDQLNLTRAVYVGQSLGGNLSQAIVRRHPERADGLVVIDATWNTAPLSWAQRLLLRSATPMLAMIPARRLPRLMADASAVTPAARADARRAFEQMPKSEFLRVWRATVDLLDTDADYRTPVPLCLIRGDQDRTGNIASAMPRWAAAEGIEEVVIPGAGHIANQDAPDAVNTALLNFLRSLTSRPI
jgi:3-oxoadipate enol-lactonase